MKLTIKVKLTEPFLKFEQHGNWIDLKVAKNIKINPKDKGMVNLGIAMKLPKDYEAYLLPRSSTFKHTNLMQTNNMGIIDNEYCGNDDIWKFPVINMGEKISNIKVGERIAQFRIQLSQNASMWSKLKWLFTSGIKIEYVEDLQSTNRGGFGSTGR